jgi:hypothetical protein
MGMAMISLEVVMSVQQTEMGAEMAPKDIAIPMNEAACYHRHHDGMAISTRMILRYVYPTLRTW